jgi:cysteine sulfinate desulfinase/cysteine desulfurase-like protein
MLPNTLLVAFNQSKMGSEIIEKLNGEVIASTGAACHSGSTGSHVLTASRYFLLENVNFFIGSKTL